MSSADIQFNVQFSTIRRGLNNHWIADFKDHPFLTLLEVIIILTVSVKTKFNNFHPAFPNLFEI